MERKFNFELIKNKYTIFISFCLILVNFSGCSGSAFRPLGSTQNETSPGCYSVPPKLDFLFVMDDTGSAYQTYSTVSAQATSFITQLDQQGWDYRFATIPLTTFRQISQVIGSVYDPNRGSTWVAPYPGATTNMMETLLSSVFRLPTNYTDIINLNSITSGANGSELSFQNITNILSANTTFLRKDAQLAILVESNGDDTGYNFCTRQADGQLVPCEQVGNPVCVPTSASPINGGSSTCGSNQTSLNYYESALKAINPNILFYAFVAATNSTNLGCSGGNSAVGTRYMTMATALNGASFDLCTQSMSQVFSSLSSDLVAQKTNYHTRYLTFPSQPNPSTIVLVKYPGGNQAQAVTIPQSPTNGWTYVGYQTNVNAVYTINQNGKEYDMNQVSGYAIELNGTAELVGSDTASLTDTPAADTTSN